MSRTINDYYFGSLLSQAAYGDFSLVDIGADGYGAVAEVKDVLISSGAGGANFTDKQAARHYSLIRQRKSTHWQ
jgi:hypothetical protein